MLKVMGGTYFTCTVTGTTSIAGAFQRVHLHCPGLLQAIGHHPTMWAGFRFVANGRPHQRAFTLINVNLLQGTFDIDVHLHGSIAGTWARAATPGTTIDAAVRGTGFAAPRASTTHLHLIGDAASIPAIDTILEAFPHIPATLWLEQQDAREAEVPLSLRPGDVVRRVPRGDGTRLTTAVQEGLAVRHAEQGLRHEWFWIACEASANRALMVHLRSEFGVPRSQVAAMAYWKAD